MPAGNRRVVRPLRLCTFRRTAGGLPAAAPGTARVSSPPYGPARRAAADRAILPSATILKPGKITGEGAARHT